MEKKTNEIIERRIKLENLNCASCASKIEAKILKMSEVKDGSYNLSNQILTVEISKEEEKNEFLSKITQIVDSIEDGVNVFYSEKASKTSGTTACTSGCCGGSSHEHSHDHDHHHEHSHNHSLDKSDLIMLIVAIIGFASSFALKEMPNIRLGVLIVSYVLAGNDVIVNAFKNLKRKQVLDENFLMTIASMGAFLIGEAPEAVGVMMFYKIGEFFQDKAVDSSRRSIQDLMDIRPDYANILKDNKIVKVDPEEVNLDDIIVVKAGEKIPLDGVITKGKTMLDTSALTGESLLRSASVGDGVMSGVINKNGVIEVSVKKTFYDSTVAKILDLVENAGAKKAETEKFITKFSRYYTPIVVILALVTAIIPPIFVGGFSVWLYRALIFLVISCPCALVVSIPLGFFAGIGNASRNGILIKGSNYLEALNKLESIAFDKTGTLTKGTFEVTKIEGDVLEFAAMAESYSNHPIAKSIIKYYGKEVNQTKIDEHSEIEGLGVKAKINGKTVLAGNAKLMKNSKIEIPEINELGTIVYVAIDQEYAGYILISDEIKVESKSAVKNLINRKLNTFMLTGDNSKTADVIAKEIGIGNVYSNLLPNEKVDIFEEIQANTNGLTAFVGDGINDAPVLRRADIGIAMGGIGSDAAIEAADIVLMEDSPAKIDLAIKIAGKTHKIVSQNIVFALGIKIAVMILGVFGFANMWGAIFADVGVALLAILNSMRVLKN